MRERSRRGESEGALDGLAGVERTPGGAEFAQGGAHAGEFRGVDVGRGDAAAAAGGDQFFRECGGIGGAAPLVGLEALDEGFTLEGLRVFRADGFGVVERGGELGVVGATKKLPEEGVAPAERRLDDEVKRVVRKDALARQLARGARAVGPHAGECVGFRGGCGFGEADEHGSDRKEKCRCFKGAVSRRAEA